MERHDDGRLHFSSLKHIADTPKLFRHNIDTEREDTLSFRLGRAVHAKWLLGQDPWVYEGRRDKRIKEYAALLEEHNGEIPLKPDEYARVIGMAKALDTHPQSFKIKAWCDEVEKPIKWERDGFQCAGTLDMSTSGLAGFDTPVLAELKSCEPRRINPMAFQRQARWYRYPEQLAWYAVGNGTRVSKFTTWPDAYIISVENKAPFDVVVHHCGPLLLDQANQNVEQWLRAYKACQASGQWPGWADDIVEFDAEVEFGPNDADD